MRRPILLAACLYMLAAPAFAGPVPPLGSADASLPVLAASAAKSFTSCMRKHYGPHYYRGVKRAHRYFMAQACGG